MDKKQVKAIADKEVRAHEQQMHSSKGIGLLKPKTSKMAKGGVTTDAMKAVGRNMARANNQRGK